MDRTTRPRLLVALALSAFLCAAALAVADVVRIGQPGPVKSDPDALTRSEEPPALLPPIGEENHVPAAPPLDEARSCTGDAACVKPKRRAKREGGRRGEREGDRPSESESRDDDRPRDDERPAALICDDAENCTELLIGTLEGVRELDEDALLGTLQELRDLSEDVLVETVDDLGALDEEALAELLCEDGDECADPEALMAELLACESVDPCEPLDLDAIVPAEPAGDVPATDDSPVPVEPFVVLLP